MTTILTCPVCSMHFTDRETFDRHARSHQTGLDQWGNADE